MFGGVGFGEVAFAGVGVVVSGAEMIDLRRGGAWYPIRPYRRLRERPIAKQRVFLEDEEDELALLRFLGLI